MAEGEEEWGVIIQCTELYVCKIKNVLDMNDDNCTTV